MKDSFADYALTEEQKQLVSKNHNLIYGYAAKKHLDIEEYYGVLAEALCMAGKLYDPKIGNQFSTLAYKCFEIERAAHIRAKNRMRNIPSDLFVSYDAKIKNEDGKQTSFLDYLSDHIQDNSDEDLLFIRDFIGSLDQREKFVLNHLLLGYKSVEIAKAVALSHQSITLLKKKIRKKWNRYCGKTNCEK